MDLHDQLLAYVQANPNTFARYLPSKPFFSLVASCFGRSVPEKVYSYLHPTARASHLTCKICGTPTDNFISVVKGYRVYCSNKCSNNDLETKVQRMAGMRSQDSKVKRKASLVEKYGTSSMITINREKALKTIRARHRADYWNTLVDAKVIGESSDKDSIYVYAYLNPLKLASQASLDALSTFNVEIAHEPFYIGYGTYKRAGTHLHLARNTPEVNHKLNTIRSIWNAGHHPIIVKLKHVSSQDEGLALEVQLIAALGTVAEIEGIKRGPLTNQTSGGEGGKPSTEIRDKLRQRRQGKIWVTNGVDQRYVLEAEVASWETRGWKRGVKPSKKRDEHLAKRSSFGSTWVTNGSENHRTNDPQFYLSQGWRLGQTAVNAGPEKGKFIWITDGTESRKVTYDSTIPDGWRLGRIRKKYPGGYQKKRSSEEDLS